MASHQYPEEKKVSPDVDALDSDGASSIDAITALVAEDHQHEIRLRTMSWQKAAWLLAGDQVSLAIMAQTWSLSVLGWVTGIITMVLAGALFWITSITMDKFIMKHPQIKDICDFAYIACKRSRVAYEFTGAMLLANNILLIGFHVLTGAKVLNGLSDHSLCTVVFSVIAIIIGIVMSLARTLHHVSFMSMFSAFCMGLAILLFLTFAGIEDAPLYGYGGNYPELGEVKTYAFPPAGTTWVADYRTASGATASGTVTGPGSAVTYVLWILFPTFIPEMENPQDYPKALAVLAGISAFLFIVPPSTGFRYLGKYSTAPAFGSLGVVAYKKAAFAFVIVPILVIGVIYANVTAKFIYFRVMGNSRHAHSNTFTGWGVWIALMGGIWLLAFVFAEAIPSMGDFLSLLGAAFDSFGFIYFAIAYYQLYKGRLFNGAGRSIMGVIHVFVLICGLFLLRPGLYTAVEAIIDDYSGGTKPAFSCANAAI